LGGRDLLSSSFAGVPVLPLVGNHDTWPYFSGGRAAREVRAELTLTLTLTLTRTLTVTLTLTRCGRACVVGTYYGHPYHGPIPTYKVRAELARLWGGGLGGTAARELLEQGYYVYVPPALANLWVVAMDTNSLALAEAAATATRQLAWFEATLVAAEAQAVQVIVVGHIAPGASHTDWRSIAAAGWAGGFQPCA
jgi:3',5'-cyclic AMP phosphodiesterase CpdA